MPPTHLPPSLLEFARQTNNRFIPIFILEERFQISEQKHIYRVSFKEPINDKTDYFFGSLSAIYDTFSAEQGG